MSKISFLVLNNRERDLNLNWFLKEEHYHIKHMIEKIKEVENVMDSISVKYRDSNKALNLKTNLKEIYFNLTKEDKFKVLKLKLFTKKEYIELINNYKDSFFLSETDLHWLFNKRKIPLDVIKKNKLFSVESFINNEELLDLIGITIHPLLKDVVNYNPNYRGICIPLYDNNDNIINITTRLIDEDENGKQKKETMKYTQSVPEYNWWGLNNYNTNYIWITEGIFDTFALQYINEPSISSSSATTNAYLYIQLLNYLSEHNIQTIKIFSDNDGVGRISTQIKKELFEYYNYNVEIYYSNIAKDAAEYIFENKKTNLKDLIKINNFTYNDFNIETNHESTSILNKFIVKI
jgi:hypothetical protein